MRAKEKQALEEVSKLQMTKISQKSIQILEKKKKDLQE